MNIVVVSWGVTCVVFFVTLVVVCFNNVVKAVRTVKEIIRERRLG